ncbi:DEAD/DEAH box helicase [Shewanella psychrotolerans]|uniref:DEAD/DEAH box helicase n=1 Tax=Shewanella psychrotolerans TaxID=2864206 RepID=UPI001C660377|nr:DEAD/DEAH box helicase [Shewanella psychrotolerans]QYJ99843.1 DEAD/DEAH box helicase [Shewanella psychrotolerans]
MLKIAHDFTHQQLFAGLQLLLQQELIDFSHNADSLYGRFIDPQGDLFTRVFFTVEGLKCECSCSQRQCAHVAALVIEYDASQPDPITARSRRADTAIRLFKSEANQLFDPFPAMARHRVLYLIHGEPDALQLSVHKGYLNKNGSYQLRGPLGFDITNSTPLPKYVSQSDLQLLYQLKSLLSNEEVAGQNDQIQLPLDRGLSADFYQLLGMTGRGFYQDALRPLRCDIHYDEDYVDTSYLIELEDKCYLEPVSHTLVIDERDSHLIGQSILENIDLDGEWLPRVEVVRHGVDFPWLIPAMMPLDVALFTMVHRGVAYNLSQLLFIAANHKPLMTQIAKCQLMLNILPLVSQQFELPISQSLASGTRLVPDDVSEHVVFFRRLTLAGWLVDFAAKKRFVKVAANNWFAEVETPNKDWFELSLGVEVDGERVNLLPLLTNLIRQGKLSLELSCEPISLELDTGELLSLPANRVARILSVLGELFNKQPLNESQQLVLPRHQLTRLPQLDNALKQDLTDKRSKALKWSGATWLRKQAQALNSYVSNTPHHADIEVPEGLNAVLRPYQEQGVSWLQFIKQHHFAGILADDMGLGKTLQTLCSILLDKEQGKLTAPVLVIAPTSLLSNWQREATTFSPSLSTLVWSGRARRDHHQALGSVDIVITSYGILAQDADELTGRHWYQVILDEAQTIKNSRSRVTKLVNRLDTSHRLCLTGTPMENHLGELWSLFHFLMPGFLGSAAQYQRQFKQPIEKDNCDTARRKLAQRIAPFMLRRTKVEVATELPKKTVINTLIELSQTQSDLYETIRLTVAEQLQLALLQTGAKANRLAISNALLKLRQVCCHPAMLKLNPTVDDDSTLNLEGDVSQDLLVAESSKLAWLENKLPNMIEDGRNILIFSSFTTMLDLIAQQLDDQGIDYEMLTGRSRHRDRIIDRFRSGKVNVFLISLKAGGSGLNLTEADVVIHVDPWWNPAAEEQASDRAYRIGQQKPVFVYKLICQNTVEERIQQLQQTKKALAQSMYQTESLSVAEMNSDDWLALLQPIADEASSDQAQS